MTSALGIEADALPDEVRRRIGYREVPGALVGRLAVDVDHQGRGLGSMLLVDAIERCRQPTGRAVLAMVVDSINEAAASWHARLGFMPYPTRSDRLFAPFETLRRALEA